MAVALPEQQLAGFISKFSPEVARVAKQARTELRRLLPGAFELVYDNYNALAVAYGPTERTSEVVLSGPFQDSWIDGHCHAA